MGQRILVINRQFLRSMFEEGERHFFVNSGIPQDACIVGSSEHYSFMNGSIAIKLESAEWPEVPPGERIPEIEVTITTIEPEKALIKLPQDTVKFREFT